MRFNLWISFRVALHNTIGAKKMEAIEINSPTDALTLALILAVTAKTEKLSQECLEHAQEIAATLNPKEVELCKMAAEVALEIQKEGKHR